MGEYRPELSSAVNPFDPMSGCYGKRRHATEELVLRELYLQQVENQDRYLAAYRCPACQGYHTGHDYNQGVSSKELLRQRRQHLRNRHKPYQSVYRRQQLKEKT